MIPDPHSTACCRHSTGVIIVALMTLPQRHAPSKTLSEFTPYNEARVNVCRAGEAEKNCPVSKVLNAEITLDAKLM
jgi:hypothetical protein